VGGGTKEDEQEGLCQSRLRCEGRQKEFRVEMRQRGGVSERTREGGMESGEEVGGNILWNGRKLSWNNVRGAIRASAGERLVRSCGKERKESRT
jgi:hypothetical protein